MDHPKAGSADLENVTEQQYSCHFTERETERGREREGERGREREREAEREIASKGSTLRVIFLRAPKPLLSPTA